jgi:hypothetical protein
VMGGGRVQNSDPSCRNDFELKFIVL